ncbi:uncharacterized protein NECHADRAFT_106586 [Fusarium vanettenii 77-13-4]|uniref:chitinase n=1 Tax=Fusarium vanettenii (strain ATCC MYA-4622 / CBS 123669 / FGSC 9596 / NRRL 45880 / 77-13-4) TaxID=660122 RepID=C7ZC39_FUSV7|nr:uncharacterized protein NECHADRAFT_106586 [Fusarium vanettenii 77-13-4]EEU38422.1 hypothetical protein NECHADRAFT_106586 [Fusarium vanettenii 77-13-4]
MSFANGPKCSKIKLYATSCCSSVGYCGTTTDHCGKGCQSTCDFKLECDKNNPVSFANHTKCPLNVYYSKHNYYGTTKEFCGKKTMNRPSCSSKGPMRRVPLDIPDSIYTYINFAFVSIDPKTFKIVLASSNDLALYRELILKKRIDPNLKPLTALIVSILTRKEDYDNLPKFLKKWTQYRYPRFVLYINYFNIITYDFYGSWDTPKSWLGNYLNSYTNLTEIKDAFNLLWRNKIDPNQVNMGLAFYARTFSISNPSYISPSYLFDAGGPA